MSASASTPWQGDALNRSADAAFLYKLVMQKFSAYHASDGAGALCFALDAPWGAGKTFFVDRWSDEIRTLDHPVVKFDAWVNDLADDPLVGFMADLRAQLLPWIKQLPIAGASTRRRLTAKTNAVFKQAGKAALPVLGTIAKSVIEKKLGVEIAELSGVLEEDAPEPLDRAEVGKITGKALDKFFDASLKSHNDKQTAIRQLKHLVEDLLGYLGKQQKVSLPLFIFIDELDRCRPDYALRLLEGVKHLFDARGICFVVSTNLRQLAASTGAVYGSNFDGQSYLKRFFSFEYLLPSPDHTAFATLLVKDSLLLKRKLRICQGLPPAEGPSDPMKALVSDFAAVSSAFQLPLRAQTQVFRQAEAAAAGIDENKSLHCFYLFFLAAAFYCNVDKFDELVATKRETTELWPILSQSQKIRYKIFDERGSPQFREITIPKLFAMYHKAAGKRIAEIASENHNSEDYPDKIIYRVVDVNSYQRDEKPSIYRYADLVRAGGQVR